MEEEKYPFAKKWNLFVKKIEEAKETWEKLQEEIALVGEVELETVYPVIAQRHIGRFKKVEFQWMISMFVEYYRGAGGIEAMYIVLPPEMKVNKIETRKEKKDAGK